MVGLQPIVENFIGDARFFPSIWRSLTNTELMNVYSVTKRVFLSINPSGSGLLAKGFRSWTIVFLVVIFVVFFSFNWVFVCHVGPPMGLIIRPVMPTVK